MNQTHTSNHIWCCAGLISGQLKCPALHHRSLHLALASVGNPQCGWNRCHHRSPRQSRKIGLFMAGLIVMKANQIPIKAIHAHVPRIAIAKAS